MILDLGNGTFVNDEHIVVIMPATTSSVEQYGNHAQIIVSTGTTHFSRKTPKELVEKINEQHY